MIKKVLKFSGWLLSLFLVGLLVYIMKPTTKNNKLTTPNVSEIKSSKLYNKQDKMIKIKNPFEDRKPFKTSHKYFIH